MSLARLARQWSRATEGGKGIGLKAEALDMLNAIGVGELIQTKAAEEQREASAARLQRAASEKQSPSPVSLSPEEVTKAFARARRAARGPRPIWHD